MSLTTFFCHFDGGEITLRMYNQQKFRIFDCNILNYHPTYPKK
jgi:hypothetical protein